jgi:ribonucleoside-diphosphate reductase alpha chain
MVENYTQAPFEDCSKETYEALLKTLSDVDLTKVVELDDNTDLSGELACAAGNCEVR